MKSHLVNQPVALWPGHTAELLRDIRLEYLNSPAQAPARAVWKPYDVVQGVAIVSISGVLVHDEFLVGNGRDVVLVDRAVDHGGIARRRRAVHCPACQFTGR